MAKLSSVVKNEKRKKLAEKQFPIRAELKKKVSDESLSWDEREEAGFKLQKLNRNGSKIRVRNRCVITGRSRGFYRMFGLSRIKLRDLALEGKIPGVTKASW
jgi:small subunit ribosomal protein S14